MSTFVVQAEQQVVVQQKLGRFLLQVQRYEMLLKALVIDSEVSGSVDTALSNLERRKQQFASKPMGYLFDELNKSYLQVEGSAAARVEPLSNGVDKPTFHTKFTLELTPEELVRTQARLEAFKNLRNRIVHHLLEDHDIATHEGCERAVALLDESYEAAKVAFDELRQWANIAIEARDHYVRLAQSPEFEDALIHGILPDGTIDWPACTAVRLLRRAERGTPPGEMTRLDIALKEIRATHPEHRPGRYFCKSWGVLLERSQEFEVRKVKGSAEQSGVTWYRSRHVAP